MAQYQKNFYGTSYYGETNVFSGVFETKEILTEEALNGVANITIKGRLPYASYTLDNPEMEVLSGTWNKADEYFATNQKEARIKAQVTCDRLKIRYKKSRLGSDNIRIKITSKVPQGAETVREMTLSSKVTTVLDEGLAEFVIDQLLYVPHTIEIFLEEANEATEYFHFHSIHARVTNLIVLSKAKLNDEMWTGYTQIPVTITESNEEVAITGITPNYAGKNKILLQLQLASSDNDLAPVVKSITATAGDTKNRTADGALEVLVDFAQLATSKTKTFRRFVDLSWRGTVPDKTKLTMRTTSSLDNQTWTNLSVPYAINAKRLRLKEGRTTGHITTPLINPASENPFLRINQWSKWSDQSHLPPDHTATSITYYLLDEKDDILYQINNPEQVTNKNLAVLKNRPFRLRIEMKRRFDKASPVVDQIQFVSDLIYEEKKEIKDKTISTVDKENTGKSSLVNMSQLTFNTPRELTDISYQLIDETVRPAGVRPEDVFIYFESEQDKPVRTNETNSLNNRILAECRPRKASETQGVLQHFQYGGGLVYYESIDETPMTPSFTPSLDTAKQYRYYVLNGWPAQQHITQSGDTLESIASLYGKDTQAVVALNKQAQTEASGTLVVGQTIQIPNDSYEENVKIYWKSEQEKDESARSFVTSKSAHNATITSADQSSDIILAEVIGGEGIGLVEWHSEEKIYFGVCNLNDIQSDYLREHRIPLSGDSMDLTYITQPGDTYTTIAEQFGIYEEDLRIKNQAPVDKKIVVGETLLIPSRIVLPSIDPRVQLSNNPYEMEIVYNSVKQQGKTVEDARMNRVILEVIEEEVEIIKEEVVRGSIPNTQDLLNNPKITAITGVWDQLNGTVQSVSYINNTHYKLTGSFIDWSPTPGGEFSEPTPGAKYYVSYKCMKPVAVKVRIGSDYQEIGGSDYLWRSKEVKSFEGVAMPLIDFKRELPPISDWADTNDPTVTEIDYLIEDNDLWVKTWIEYDKETGKAYAVGSLEGRRPKDNWFPTIHTGYYYLGKDEYYLFSEPKAASFTESTIPIAENVRYVEGKYNHSVKLQKASRNLILNSGFEKKTEDRKIVFKKTF